MGGIKKCDKTNFSFFSDSKDQEYDSSSGGTGRDESIDVSVDWMRFATSSTEGKSGFVFSAFNSDSFIVKFFKEKKSSVFGCSLLRTMTSNPGADGTARHVETLSTFDMYVKPFSNGVPK